MNTNEENMQEIKENVNTENIVTSDDSNTNNSINENTNESKETNDQNDSDVKLDDFVEKKQIKISLTQFIFIIMFIIVMILAAIQNLLYFKVTGI